MGSFFGKSADGKGRSILEILTFQNKRDMTAQEFQVHNPLQAKIGCSVTFNHLPEASGLTFFIQAIHVFETTIGNKNYYHTDYLLRATVIGNDKPVKIKLRLIPDEDSSSEIGHKIQVLEDYCGMGAEDAEKINLRDVLADEVFQIFQDDDGNPYDESDRPTYWRVDDVKDPYHARVMILKDLDGDGSVQADEMEYMDVTYWDYHRNTIDSETNQQFTEYLSVEQEEDSEYFSFYRGRDVEPFQVVVV